MDTVRIGIVGCGGMGSFHANYLNKGEVSHARLTAVCDINPARLQFVRKTYGEDIKLFDNIDALLAADVVDAVLIATPHYDHPPLAIKALQAGVHVLSEKPAGVYTKQVRELNQVAAASDRVFAVMFNQRCRPVHQKLKELIAAGELGEIRRSNWIITDWFRTQSYYDAGGWRATWKGEGGGVLINQCPHNLDLWQWFCGTPRRVRAFCSFGKYHDIEVEDDVTAYAEYENGATGVFITTTGEAPGTNRLEITGDRGKVVLEEGQLTFWRTRESVAKFLRECPDGFAMPEVWRCEIPSGDAGEEHKGVTRKWVEAIRNGTPLVARGEEGIRSLEISNAMMLSSWIDDWVELPVDEELFYAKLQERIAASTFEKKSGPGRVMSVDGTF
jgi:predicted dehydrogenase